MVRYFFVDNCFVMFVIMFAAAAIAGGLWGGVTGFLKSKWGVNETITTLMLNYVAINICEHFIYGPWKDPSSMREVAKTVRNLSERDDFNTVSGRAENLTKDTVAVVFSLDRPSKYEFGIGGYVDNMTAVKRTWPAFRLMAVRTLRWFGT